MKTKIRGLQKISVDNKTLHLVAITESNTVLAFDMKIDTDFDRTLFDIISDFSTKLISYLEKTEI